MLYGTSFQNGWKKNTNALLHIKKEINYLGYAANIKKIESFVL